MTIQPFRIVLFAVCIGAIAVGGGTLAAEPGDSVALHWLGLPAPLAKDGVSWGVPWPKGKVQPKDALVLKTADGKSIPMQTWPLAYWQDGSIKWSGHAIAASPAIAGALTLSRGEATKPETALTCSTEGDVIEINAGALRCRIPKRGGLLFESLTLGNRKVAENAKLIATIEDRSEHAAKGIIREEPFESRVTKVTLEQSGPIRAVVKIEGTHSATKSDRTLLPFTVRLYFFAGSETIRIVHSFVFDGDGNKDFIKGLGISFSVPLPEQLQNRHVRFVGDGDGVWVQPVRLLAGYRNALNANEYANHLAGQRMPNYGANPPENVSSLPVWNDFRLTQLAPDSFAIDKRTTSKSSWLHVNNGRRSLGMAVLGDVSGGIAVGVQRFWEKYPRSIEITNAASAVGEMKIWLWSPDGSAMDLRHYDTTGHGLTTNYEDWKLGWDSPFGIANTSDLTLTAFAAIPANADLLKMAKSAAEPPLLVCDPSYYHAVGAFGVWSLPDKSSPAKKWIEEQLEQLFTYYRDQIEERHWYGYWDYGDIMHNYDVGRHEWRYDIGGWAWTNTELMPDMYLYYMFLRSGRADIFRMAEAMTRHTSEVDVHHIGPFAPLGSRHNVNHWGDGAKQPRVSHAGIKRFYYYLTTDERTGDLMHEQLDADQAYNYVQRIDPRRGGAGAGIDAKAVGTPVRPNPDDPARFATARLNLDWMCYAINWMTEAERTGEPLWRDRTLAGMKAMVGRSQGGAIGGGYFDMIFGGPENMFELQSMIDYPEFWSGWAATCASLANTSGNNMTAPRMAAYAAFARKDAALGRRAWEALIGNGLTRGQDTPIAQPKLITGPDVLNPVHDPVFLGRSAGWQLHGPASVQWALNAIETLELAKDYLPAWEAAR